MLKDLKLYAQSAIRHTSSISLICLLSDIAMVVFYSVFACYGSWYLIAIIISADLLRFLARGAWYRAPFHKTAHYHEPSKDANAALSILVRIAVLGFLCSTKFVMSLMQNYLGHILYQQTTEYLRIWSWYILASVTVIETFRCLLHTMHKHNEEWMQGTNGNIGIPNWISIVRMAISIIVPHIYTSQSFGEYSNIAATMLLVIAISTDAIDGFVARMTNSITKVGKYLDPLSDKIIFAPNAIAFVWLLYRSSKESGRYSMMCLTCFFMAVAFARDILFFVWFFTKGRKIPSGIGASMIDKIRMAGICLWLLTAAIALSLGDSKAQTSISIISVMLIASVALLSVLSIKIDYERLKQALQTKAAKH